MPHADDLDASKRLTPERTIDASCDRPLRIAFLYIAEAYQCYHGAAIAIALARHPGVEVVSHYHDPDTPRHLERIRRAFDAPEAEYRPLRRSVATRLLQGLKRLGSFKERELRDNRAELDGFDAIVSVENTVAAARDVGVTRPLLIYTPHGFGDRAYGFVPRIATFDFVLLAGVKTETRMLADGLVRPGAYALTGSVKLETAARLALWADPLFAKPGPTVLYNPHFAPELSSWGRFIDPMLAGFDKQDGLNLLVAPHVKLFARRSAAARRRWEARSTERIRIDTGSDRSVDTSYLAASDVYVGDSSSQLYEFLWRPRPCVFLNAHGAEWRDDPNFAHWHLGEVVDRPDRLMGAIAEAPARHGEFVERQRRLTSASLGEHHDGAAKRGADAIWAFLLSRADVGPADDVPIERTAASA